MQTAHDILNEIFGYDAFRGSQEAVIETLVAGQDALVLMPTGAGKSLCYQLPGIARGGTTQVCFEAEVVSPWSGDIYNQGRVWAESTTEQQSAPIPIFWSPPGSTPTPSFTITPSYSVTPTPTPTATPTGCCFFWRDQLEDGDDLGAGTGHGAWTQNQNVNCTEPLNPGFNPLDPGSVFQGLLTGDGTQGFSEIIAKLAIVSEVLDRIQTSCDLGGIGQRGRQPGLEESRTCPGQGPVDCGQLGGDPLQEPGWNRGGRLRAAESAAGV